ncbi:phosphoribosyl-ATP pyrophosphohydrolase/phosphoribosyl-AMP cyclohydrolase [Desulfohalotomaculum tongense]|uniref:bifunctional phosphoribosyl-AMP cyclohydrolase/phosphoribosyl-ATP diphosphatase HisIE n=1 Tax=Desulforadius tongensis TaxID=1216062 RepID=UPI00195BE33C|nr:phosphoribosyl-ATP pyrophosphohydrolase/phosphoribosyl-AMP cyclohydrolase [Desulforadius tongensis]
MKFSIDNLKFNQQGLIPAIVQDSETREVLMMAWMNKEAVEKTLSTGETWFYSRSRQKMWHKGETSGHVQKVKAVYHDCDGDTLLVLAEQTGGGACHEGYKSCFHYLVHREGKVTVEGEQQFNPQEVYRDAAAGVINQLYNVILQRKEERPEGSYTTYLFNQGVDKICKKIGEEAAEVIIGAKNRNRDEVTYEAADLIYHLLVLLAEQGIAPGDIYAELAKRRK